MRKWGNGYIPTSIFAIKNKIYCEVTKEPPMQSFVFNELFKHWNVSNDCNHLPVSIKANKLKVAVKIQIHGSGGIHVSGFGPETSFLKTVFGSMED